MKPSTRCEAIPKEKVKFAKKYPILVMDTVGVTMPYQKLHWHDVLEINLIKSGCGYYIINGQRFDFQEGDILLINSNDLHCAYETKDLVMTVITFDANWIISSLRLDPDILSPFREMGRYYTNLLDRSNPAIAKLKGLLLELQSEHNNEQCSYCTAVYSLLMLFLANINREFRLESLEKKENAINEHQLEKMRFVIRKMESDYAYPWLLEELAALVYLSPSRFSDIFKRAVGVPPLLYLIQIRLENALQMLECSDKKITDIALECGFRTVTNFNRLFKKHIGVTPKTSRLQQGYKQ
ncbi:AraC family transcriptional regulator [Paenibacillaceae bacterium]|nr:AraC family transcriptional regulator [Paenibacillaceae bacterium]